MSIMWMILQDISETVSVEQASDQLNGNAAPSSRWGGTSTGPRDTGTPTHTEPGKKVGAQTFRICHPFLYYTHTTHNTHTTFNQEKHGIMGRRFPDGGFLRYRN